MNEYYTPTFSSILMWEWAPLGMLLGCWNPKVTEANLYARELHSSSIMTASYILSFKRLYIHLTVNPDLDLFTLKLTPLTLMSSIQVAPCIIVKCSGK